MKYMCYVHKDENSAYGATFPDFPGVFTAADNLDELERNAQEALELAFEDEDASIPTPTYDAVKLRTMFPDDDGGFWLLVNIDTSKFSKAVRLNISLPERLVQQIDAAAKERHMSRSAFLAMAAQHEMEHA